MRIITYGTEFDNNMRLKLVQEKCIIYGKESALDSPKKIVRVMNEVFGLNRKAEEFLYLITCLKDNPTGFFEISHGSVDYAQVRIADVLKRVLLSGAVNFIIVHNHPSGNPNPSIADLDFTRTLQNGASVLSINFLDHIILGNPDYFSFKEKNMLMEE